MGDFCKFTINSEVVAKYLNDELERRTNHRLKLADYIKGGRKHHDVSPRPKAVSVTHGKCAVQFKQVALASAGCRRINSKTASPFW